MNSLRIQQQAFGRATDLAIASVRVCINLRQQKKDEKKGGMAPPTTEAPCTGSLFTGKRNSPDTYSRSRRKTDDVATTSPCGTDDAPPP
jgi:hypothetical protein